jgi:hypothetical protein
MLHKQGGFQQSIKTAASIAGILKKGAEQPQPGEAMMYRKEKRLLDIVPISTTYEVLLPEPRRNFSRD